VSEKPTVLHIVGSLEGGGAERWVRELVPRLNARGIRSDIVTVYPPRLDAAEVARLGCQVYHRSKRPGFDIKHFAWLCGLIRELKPHVVHTHQWAGKYVGRSAAILAQTPFVVHTEHSPLPVSQQERIMAFILSLKTDAVISFNQHKADLIRARERVANFEIIRNGIPIPPRSLSEQRAAARQELDVAQDAVIFGMVGSLQERKNPFLALRAFKRIQDDDRTPTRLDFFGDGPLRAALEEEALAAGISARVRFHGFRSDVRQFLGGLDVFLTLATQEMAPISMLEAMAAELPIIGAPHPGTVEMIADNVNGALVDWNIDDVAFAMRTARDDKQWRSRCGAAGRILVERDYDIELIADEHVAFYKRLVRRRFTDISADLHLTSQL